MGKIIVRIFYLHIRLYGFMTFAIKLEKKNYVKIKSVGETKRLEINFFYLSFATFFRIHIISSS